MERLKRMKETLTSIVESQVMGGDLSRVDAEELGEVVDMVKDLAEAIYYCTVTEAMEDHSKEKGKEEYHHYYTERYVPELYYPRKYDMMYTERDMDRDYGRMYYPGGGSSGGSSGGSGGQSGSSGGNNARGGGTRGFYEPYPMMMERDEREGKSPYSRKSYMEAKETHQDKAVQMKELDKYIHELGDDITEMIHDASPEEKAMLQQKISTLATKIK